MTINKITIAISLFICWNTVISQEINFEQKENKIVSLAKTILEAENDSLKIHANNQLKKTLIQVLNTKKSYLYEFKETEHISILQPKNKKIKIITWFIPYVNGSFEYFGIIQKCNKRGKKCDLYILEDNADLLANNAYNNVQINNWYGCIYYDIIITNIEKETYYTLLGWDGNDSKTTKKIIDVLNIKKNEAPFFGANIFNNKQQRIIIEYSSKYPVSLKYDQKLEYIVFDHLEPMDGISIGSFNLYAPNLSYDIFKKTKLGWELEEKIYLNNEK